MASAMEAYVRDLVQEEVSKALLLAQNPLLTVKYTLTHEKARLPYRKNPGDIGWDLFTVEDMFVNPQQFMDVPTGICVGMPQGLWCRITGRSSTLRTHGLQVQEGIIDTGYIGELFTGIRNVSVEPVFIPAGSRLAQAIFHVAVIPNVWEFAEVLTKFDGRGSQGFGSTGTGETDEQTRF